MLNLAPTTPGVSMKTTIPGTPKVHIYTQKEPTGKVLYRVCWMEGGIRCRKGFADWTEAQTAADLLQQNIDIRGTSLRDLRYYKLCEERLGGIPLDKAVQFYLEQHAITVAGVTIPTLVSDYLKRQTERKDLSLRQLQSVRQHLRAFSEAFPQRVNTITASQIDDYLDNPDWGSVAKHNHRQSIISLFKYAKRKGHLPKTEETEAELSEDHKSHGAKKEIWSPEEMLRLIASARSESGKGAALAFLGLGAFAGIRAAEIGRLDWGNIDLGTNRISLPSSITKTRNARAVPIPGNLADILTDCPRDGIAPCASRLYPILKDTCSRAGLEWKPNACRHSFASYHLALHGDLYQTALITGHSVKILNNTYKMIEVGGRLITPELAQDWFNIR